MTVLGDCAKGYVSLLLKPFRFGSSNAAVLAGLAAILDIFFSGLAEFQ